MNCKDSEIDFLKDDQSRIIISVGVKGSSKTFTILNYIKFCIKKRRFHTYFLIMPNYSKDHDKEQYNFLSTSGARVFIYSRYSPVVMKQIMSFQLKNDVPSLLIIDDATSSGHDISTDEQFQKAVTESRHIQLTVWFVTHALSKVIAPVIRANIDYLFLYKITNDKLLEKFFEEYLSLFPDFKIYKEFKHMYFELIRKVKYNGFFLNFQTDTYCFNVKNWMINTEKLDIGGVKKAGLKEVKVDATRDKMVEQLKLQLAKIKMKKTLQNNISE